MTGTKTRACQRVDRITPSLVITLEARPEMSVVPSTLRVMSIEGVLRRQAGVITRAQALAEGVSSAMIGRRVSSGAWVRMHPEVYLVADRALTAEARLCGAVLWAGPAAVVSGVAAAWWHGLRLDKPSMIDLTVPHSWKRTRRPGVRVRRRDLPGADVTETHGVQVTALPLTVLESAVDLGPAGSSLLDRALQSRVGFEDLYLAHCRNLGRRGSAAGGELLRAAGDRAASAAERVAVALLRSEGFTGWECGYRLAGYEVDIAFPARRVAIEIDGWAWHTDVERFRRDRRRQNTLVLAGWTVLRFTWDDLIHRPDRVVAEIRRALET